MRKFSPILPIVFMSFSMAVAAERPVSGVVAVTTGLLQASYTDGAGNVGRDVDTGGAIFLDDLVSTGRGVKSQILLKDHSVFTIGENSKIVFDTFVYDPRTKDGKLTANITQGVFRFVSGNIASKNPEQMTVNVGTATVGVRGTAVAGRVTEEGTELILLSGQIDVSTDQGTQEIIKPGWGVSVSPLGEVSPPAPVPEARLETLLTDLSTADDESEEASEEAEAEPTEEGGEETASDDGGNEDTAEAQEEEEEVSSVAEAEAEEETEAEEQAEVEAEAESGTETESVSEDEAAAETETAAVEEDAPSQTEVQTEAETAAEAETETQTETAQLDEPVVTAETQEVENEPVTAPADAENETPSAPVETAALSDAPALTETETEPTVTPVLAPAPSEAPQPVEAKAAAIVTVAATTPATPPLTTPATTEAPPVNQGPPVTVPQVQPVEINQVPEPSAPSAFDQVVLQTLAARAAAVAVAAPELPAIPAPSIASEIIAAVTRPTEQTEAVDDAPSVETPVETETRVVTEVIEPEAIVENVADNRSREETVVTIRAERNEPIVETPEPEAPSANQPVVEEPEPVLPTLTAVRGEFETIGEHTDTSAALVVGQVSTDDGSDTIVYELGGADAQYFEISSDGLVRLRANTGLNFEDTASYDITVAARNESGDSARQAFSIAISDENDLPVITTTTPPGSEQDAVFTYVLGAQDEDAGEALAFNAETLPSWLSLGSNSNGETILTGTPGNDDVGRETIVLTVNDGTGSSEARFDINVANINDAPTLSSLSGIAFTDTSGDDSFAAATGTATGTDIDVNDSLTYGLANGVASNLSGYSKQVAGTYGTLYLDEATGDYRYVPDDEAIEGLKSATSETFTVSVIDGSNASANGTLTVNVSGANDAPTLSSLSGIAFTDTSGDDSFAAATGTATGSDLDASEVLTYGVDGGVATNLSGYTKQVVGTYGTFYVNETTGAYQYVPDDAAIEGLKGDANERFDVSVTDGSGAVAQGEITVNVSGANDAPTLSSLAAISLTDSAGDDAFSATNAAVTASDLDVGETFTYGLSGGVASTLAGYDSKLEGSYGTLHINESTGNYTYVPDDDKVEALSADAAESFDISVSDGSGANATGTVNVNINAVNDAPVNLSISNAVIPSTVAYGTNEVTSDNLLSNAELANSAAGWDKTNICSSNTCGTVTDGMLKTGPNASQLKQDVDLVSALGLTDEQVSKGGVLSWSTEVWMNSNFCMGAYVSDDCNDTATVAVTATNAAGQSLVNEEDKRTQKANWETWTQSKNVNEAPTNVTYVMNGKDYTYWGCCGYGPQFRNPSLTYSYTISDDIVVGSLAADDAESDGLSFSLNNDASGMFEIRGNQLILKGGSEINQSGNNAFSLSINVTDANGTTSALPLSISVADVAGVAEQIQQQLQSNEDVVYTFEADFGAGETVSGVSLPSWLSLTDLSNGLVRLTGTAPHSGSTSFSLVSSKNGKRTTSHYTITVDDNCTGAYCTQFVSSNDTVNLATYSVQDGDHFIDDTKFHNFSSWDAVHAALSAGTGTYERTDLSMNSVRGGGDWTGNMRYEIDYGNRTVESTLWGSFTGYDNGNGAVSGSFTSEDLMDFAKANSDCYSRAGQCYTNRTPTSQLTCTGTGGTCTADNHAHVSAVPVGMVQLLQDGNGAFAAIGQMQVSDDAAAGAEVANTDVMLLDPQ